MNYLVNVKILTWQSFFIGLSFWSPITAIYFSQVAGSYTLGLSIFSLSRLSSAIFEVPTGVFSDFIGRKNTTTLGGLFYTLSMVVYALSQNYTMLVIGAIFEGLARSFYSGNNDALLYDSLQQSKQSQQMEKFMGFIGSAEHWALGFSALLGGLLSSISFRLVIWLSVLPLFLCFISSLWLTNIPSLLKNQTNIYLHIKEALSNFITNKKLRLLSLSSITGYGLGEASFQFQTVFIASLWPLWAIGVARMLSNIFAALGFAFSGKLLKKIKAIHILLLENIYTKLAKFISYLFPSVVSPVLLSSTSILYGPSMVAENSTFQKNFTDQQRATMGSLDSLGKSISLALAALILGKLADVYSPRIALIIGQFLEFFSLWLLFKLYRLLKE